MKIRKSQPKNNKYYIRKPQGGLSDAVYGKPTIKGANVLCNCVGYAGSRFNEIINDPNLNGTVKAFKYQLVCNAEDFIESAKKQGLRISETPIEGGIMVWAKGRVGVDSDGAGHVAVVEEVYEDGTILTSESGWNAWAFKTITRSNANGRWGQSSAYKFRGCIINPSVKNPKVVPVPKLVVDGIGGEATIRATQRYFGTPIDGIISGQSKAQKKYYPSIVSVEFGSGGSAVVKKLQKWCKVTQDGILGKNTVKAWQKKIGVETDGIFGVKSMKAWQKYLNAKLYPSDKAEQTTQKEEQTATTPQFTTPKGVYQFIDVSDWQDKIDWSKVKNSGVVGAIIRYADGDTLDKRFAENMKNATAAGLHIGAYIFSRAKTKAEAEKEAERLFNACKPYKPDMPMYIDLEAKGLEKYADTAAIAFLNKMASLGGRGGVYANLNWWNNYLKKTASDYSANPFWIAQYNTTMDYKPASLMGMWQYSSSGKVDGISGKVDMDYCYVAYWETTKVDEQQNQTDFLQPWFDAMVEQFNWSKNQEYKFNAHPNVENSKTEGTCITFPAVSLQRIGLLPKGKYFYLYPKTMKIAGNGKDYVLNHPEIFEVFYPNKTINDLWDKGQIKIGDFVGYGNPNYHSMVFMGMDEKNRPLFNSMGHSKKLKGRYSSYATRQVNMIVRIKKIAK